MFEDPRLKKGVIYLSITIVLILFLPFLLTRSSCFGFASPETGPIGDTIGGIMGPFVAIVAAILTFLAFWVQYQANEQLRKDIRIDRLETRIYEMLNLHKQNVSELRFNGTEERNIFPLLINELKFIHLALEEVVNQYKELAHLKGSEKLSSISYLIFFLGIRKEKNEYLSKLIEKEIGDFPTFDFIISINLLKDDKSLLTIIKDEDLLKELQKIELKGHNQRLGHYFRHLYHIVRYIADYSSIILSESDKKEYIKTIRGQLSNYEQLLLYYNALSPFGRTWIEKGYIQKYQMIKNIPLPLADFGYPPQKKFAKEIEEANYNGNNFFEWED